MDNRLKRMLYLTEYDGRKNKDLINENINNLFESKQTEQQALNILKKGGVDENIGNELINKFKTADESKNQALIPTMAKAYLETGNNGLNGILVLFKSISELIKQNKIGLPQISNNGYTINNKTFPNYLKLSEFVHGLEGLSKGYNQMKGEIKIDSESEPMEFKGKTSWNGIRIYDGNDVGKCIKYGTGDLTGNKKGYQFCIGKPVSSGNMWQSYRDSKGSTFYYIIDSNKKLEDPLHIVVLDNTIHGIELTDENNSTGHIAEYGDDVDAYLDYLRSKGVPVEELVNKPKTPEEDAEQQKLGNENGDLDWFKQLDYKEKSKYIGRGHLLSDDQFNYMWQFKNNEGGYKLLNQYLDTGQPIPEEQFKVLVGEE